MAWPNNDIETTQFDEGTDSPSLARSMLHKALLAIKSIITARGTADGIASLDAEGHVPDTQIRRGQASGVCELNSAGQIPDSRFKHKVLGWLQGRGVNHKWTNTSLSLQKPDGTYGTVVNLKGESGDRGLVPAHQWSGPSLRFIKPNGAWGTYVNLRGHRGSTGASGNCNCNCGNE